MVADADLSAVARGGGAAQAVVDRAAEAVLGDRHDCDPGERGAVETAQHCEQIGCRSGEVAGAAQPLHLRKAGQRVRAKGEQGLAGAGLGCGDADGQTGCVMAREHAR